VIFLRDCAGKFLNEDTQCIIDAYHPDAPSVPGRDNIYFPNRITLDSLGVVERSGDAAIVRANLTLTDDSGETEQVVHTYQLRPNGNEWDIYYFVVGTEIPDTGTGGDDDTESPEVPSVTFQREYEESQTEGTDTGILTITHASGETLRGSNVYIRGTGIVAVEGAAPDVTSRDTQWASVTGAGNHCWRVGDDRCRKRLRYFRRLGIW